MNKKSNVKNKEFYQEAEEIQDGWGRRLKSIDELKDKIKNKKDITLSDFVYTLYGEGHSSYCWEAFELHCKQELKYARKRMVYQCWWGLFDKWFCNIYCK